MRKAVPYLFIGPALAHLAVFALFPIGYAAWVSLFKWDIFDESHPFVGLGNYGRILGDEGFWRAMGNSLAFTVTSVPLGMAVALGVALLLHAKSRRTEFFRTAFYLPSVVSQVANAMVWIWVFLPKNGLVNSVAGLFGAEDGTDFLQSSAWAMPAIVFMSVWVGLGPRMVLYLAGLLGIPEPLYEAARIDGAGAWRQFWSVTLPMLAPTTFFVLVTSSIGAMQMFTPVYMMTKGGPEDRTDVVGYHVYTTAWRDFRIGEAAAQSFFLLAVVLALSLVQARMMRRSLEGYGAS